MKKPINIKSFGKFNYYSFEPAQYRSCREKLEAENWKSARILNHILLVMLGACTALSLLDVISRSFVLYYAVSLCYTAFVEILLLMPSHRNCKNIRAAGIDIGFAGSGLMFFGIIASIADPHQVATSFLVMQTLVSLFLNYSLWHLMLFEFGYMLIFDISSCLVKTPAVASGDILNALSFFIVSVFVAYFFHKERIRNYMKNNHYHLIAHIDSLTGLLSHQYFFKEVERIMDSEIAENLVFAVFDIDHFKDINDNMGHQAGDYYIRAVAANVLWILLNTSPEPCDDLVEVIFPEGKQAYIEHPGTFCGDYYDWGDDRFEKAKVAAGRIGGDEFAVLAGGPDPLDRIRQIRDAIRTITLPDGNIITCSVGCVQITENQMAKVIYKSADEALYEAKKNGRDQICIADDVMNQRK